MRVRLRSPSVEFRVNAVFPWYRNRERHNQQSKLYPQKGKTVPERRKTYPERRRGREVHLALKVILLSKDNLFILEKINRIKLENIPKKNPQKRPIFPL